MNRKVFMFIMLSLSAMCLFSQENQDGSFKKTFRSELKIIEAKLSKKPNDPTLNYKYGLLCYRLCRYRESRKALYTCIEEMKNNAYFFLDLYNIEMALKIKKQALEFYYKYLMLSKKLPQNTNYIHSYKEIVTETKPTIANNDLSSVDYYPYVLKNDRIKYLTISGYSYAEPTSPLLVRNYLTDEISFSDPDFKNSKIVRQPSKTSEGFSYNAFCLNKNQDKIYMTRYDGKKKRMIICVSEKEELNWGPFRTLDYIDTQASFNFMHPMLSENENQLIFTSDKEGGQGGYDLWIADIIEHNKIKNVRNLGNKINTIGNECFPTKYDNNEIFFSSDGHPGYGSLDLYRVNISQTGASDPINLGATINSERDEYGLFYLSDNQTGLYTSNRSVDNTNMYIDKIYKVKINVFDCEILNFEIKNPFATYENYANLTPNGANQSLETHSNLHFTKSMKSNPASTRNENVAQSNPSQSSKSMEIQSGDNSQAILYESKNEKIEEKFIRYSDNESIPKQNSNAMIENKFWTTAKLWFKSYDIAIGYTYVRVIDPKNEVVYSNYTTENGMINVEVVETNQYTIEIPRFKTSLKGVVFKRDNNDFYFPYELDKSANSSVNVSKNTNNTGRSVSNNETKATPIKSNRNLSLAIPSKSARTSYTPTINNYNNPSKRKLKSKDGEKKLAPRNMIENFN